MPRPQLPPTLLPNQSIIRHHILYEALLGTPVSKAFSNFCDAFGNGQIEYINYQFWYCRFYRGEFNMEYDPSADPKPKQLTDMPPKIFSEIISYLDVEDRLNVARASPILRDNTELDNGQFDSLKFDIDEKRIRFELYKIENMYHDKKWVREWYFKESETGEPIDYGTMDPIEDILKDVAIAFKNSKIKMKYFRVRSINSPHSGSRRFVNSLQSICMKSNFLFNVRKADFDIDETKEALRLLSLLKPGILEEINIDPVKQEKVFGERILQMDQFKQAKIININRICFNPTHFEHFYHFNRFEINFDSILVEDLNRLRDNLSKSTTFEYCYLYSFTIPFDYMEIATAFGALEGDPGTFSRIYEIPESTENINFTFDEYGIEIIRGDFDSESEESESEDDI